MGLSEWAFGQVAARKLKGKSMGKIWQALNGWKTWLMAIVMILELVSQGTAYEGPLGYVRSAANALGWKDLAPAVDPGVTSAAILTLIAVGHKLVKAVRQYRAGVPIGLLHP